MAKLGSISLALAFAAFVLLIAGCGGGDAASSLSRAELREQADAICEKVHNKNFKEIYAYAERHKEEFAKVKSQQSQAGLGKAILAVTVPILKQGNKELEALDAPAGEREKVEKYVAAMNKVIKTIEENPESKHAASPYLFRKTHKLGRAYEFGYCRELP
jgi:hypothetical protein